jgi:putative ABC transport system permease protein
MAVPEVIYFMYGWLHNFAYRIRLNLWIFAFPGFVIFGFSLVIITLLTFFAATRNPDECLRNE